MTDLQNKLPLDAAEDILVGAAALYWLNKASSGDPDQVDHDGRIVPTVKVKNDAEYAAVVAGQIGVGHVLWAIFGMPYLVITISLFVIAPSMWLSNQGLSLLSIPLFFLWIYVFVWRLFIKKILTKGPKVGFHRDYRGMLH